MPEERGLGQRRRDRAAVDDHEGLLGAGAAEVERLGDELFPGARLAGDQDSEVGERDLGEAIEDRSHPRVLGDEGAEGGDVGDGDALGPRRLEDHLGLADAELGGDEEEDLAHAHAADEGAVAAPEIAHAHALLGGDELGVHRAAFAVVEDDLAGGVAADDHRIGADLDPGRARALRGLDAPAADLDSVLSYDRGVKHLEAFLSSCASWSREDPSPEAACPR